MFQYRSLVLALVLALSACGPPTKPTAVRNVAAATRAAFKNVDSIFSSWSKPNGAGCALGVLSAGQLLYSHGYGLADIEHAIPVSSTTTFQVDSISKQFTAFAIFLLTQDGKLSIDDDVRKYLPELHDFHQIITIRELLHHTSGFRDDSLLALAGWRFNDAITQQDLLNLAWRQEELNFPPGQEFLYSDMGYTLLAAIVERVAGMSFREFTDRRIFVPLGMSHTHFQEHYGDLIAGRAYSYELNRSGYQGVALSSAVLAPTGLFSTVGDLRHWDENFYTGEVGGKDLLTQIQIKGKLNNGKEINYAAGLSIGEYRGLQTVEDNATHTGFQSDLLRFPAAHFSVIVLCNAGDADPSDLARKTTDILLDSQLRPLAPEPPESAQIRSDPKPQAQPTPLTSEQLSQYEGSFYSGEVDKSYTVSVREGKLFISDTRSEDELAPMRADVFHADFPFDTITYDCTKTRRCNSFVVSNSGVRALRFQRMNLTPTVVIKLGAATP
jgi:CubicO group peptidase (beta-lactamase class C family)